MENKNFHCSLAAIGSSSIQQQAVDRLLACNRYTSPHGLSLTLQQSAALIQTQANMLKKSGRIEFGPGAAEPLIAAFYDSPYLSQENYEQTLHELIALFYDFKNDTWEVLSDSALIEFMKSNFNQTCGGSLELLSQALSKLSRHIHNGYSADTFKLCTEE